MRKSLEIVAVGGQREKKKNRPKSQNIPNTVDSCGATRKYERVFFPFFIPTPARRALFLFLLRSLPSNARNLSHRRRRTFIARA